MSADQVFADRLQQLRLDFISALPARLDAMYAALEQHRIKPEDPAQLRLLHRMLHSLSGTAGTFGSTRLGEEARLVEHAVSMVLAVQDYRTADLSAISDGVAALREIGTT